MAKGEYPAQLKIAKVIALYRKGEKYNPGNYRPISLLSCLNKLFEKNIMQKACPLSKNRPYLIWLSIWISKTTLHYISTDWIHW